MNLSLITLSSILTIAGLIHIVAPKVFLIAMPPYIPWHLEIIYFTGVLEIIFAIGMNLKKYRNISCLLTALYFIAILPAHIHVAINEIPMFGISSPLLLWGRTLLQFPLIYWAWSLRNKEMLTSL